MSSYQFVNSLAACYNNGQRGGGDPGSGDYYTGAVAPNGGSVVSGVNPAYPNCYSPQMPTAPTQATANYYGSSPPHHQVTGLGGGPEATYRNMNGGGPGVSTLLALGNLGPHNNNNNNPACKYAGSVSAAAGAADPLTVTSLNNCGSPQDLTTNSNGSSSASSVCSTPRSPPLGSGAGGGQRSSHSQNSQSTASSNNSTSPNSTSGAGGQGQGGSTKGSSSTPPHIYPWMKRVHLGQSKQKFIQKSN